ncbi:phage replisome organizer N-terminal domain-containing protein [Desulfitobacterium chlororespirans]|uniref:Phage replisome organizer, putative, N-terminal region n=1 Tax=Desulfitobacterium chlororespirans DSM 11544 TaxID=1121395 RepID=A0A1M7U314_9FIRM|nr:phage replisome organizer N-terminal domain-containing protein [Desulfitobacterium chlororespirans]SHN77441.1 phage replisome organizer, putative, N-terminal region [Desulfitobacterium chlororespirans DSM 11544]
MADVKWIKLATNMFDDEKIDFISSLPEADSILLIWIRLLTLAGKCNAGGYILLTENIPYTEDMLAHKFRKPASTVKLALETFRKLGMMETDEMGLFLPNWEKHQNIEGLEKIREQTAHRVSRYRQKQRELQECNVTSNASSNVTVTQSNATDLDIDQDIDININGVFESIWKLYPKKEGKGQVSKTQKAKLAKIGIEEMSRAIERYKKAKEGHERRYLQNGSTFFNSGYVDYLDENYQEAEAHKPEEGPKKLW